MGQISPAAINIIVLAVALLLYGLVWYATRNMSRFAQVLARLSPVGLVIPAMAYVSALKRTSRASLTCAGAAARSTVSAWRTASSTGQP